MKYENEITVEVNATSDELTKLLDKYNFVIKEQYDIIDIYMLKNGVEIKDNYLQTLSNCVLIRNIITDSKNMKKITYKYKQYNENGDIIKQSKVDCNIDSIDEAYQLLQAIGYHQLIEIRDHLVVYANEKTEFAVQYVNDKHIYIEIEEKCNYIDRVYKNTNEMIEDLKQYNIPIKDENYYAKKAEIELKETMKL